MQPEPSVTVLMPLYNGERYVRTAVDSILRQTWRDFELLIIDDGSNDSGPEVVTAIEDERIVFLRNPRNMGVAATLNRGLETARGRYIARMDADDISLLDRLERQVRFMDEHSDVGISGSWVRFFGIGVSTTLTPPCASEALRCYALFENPLCHMSVMMRRGLMQKHKLLYDGVFSRSEDYELWSRSLRCFPLANISRVLVRARQHAASATLSNWQEMTAQTEIIQARMLGVLGITPRPEEQKLHHQVGRGLRQPEMSRLIAGERWLRHVCRFNQATGYADVAAFANVVGQIWLRFCTNSAPLGVEVWRCWRDSPLKRGYAASMSDQLRLAAGILWHLCRNAGKNKLKQAR